MQIDVDSRKINFKTVILVNYAKPISIGPGQETKSKERKENSVMMITS